MIEEKRNEIEHLLKTEYDIHYIHYDTTIVLCMLELMHKHNIRCDDILNETKRNQPSKRMKKQIVTRIDDIKRAMPAWEKVYGQHTFHEELLHEYVHRAYGFNYNRVENA